MVKKVLLTGASGFIGRQSIQFMIENDYEVHAVSHITPLSFKKEHNLFWHQCDLLNIAQQRALLEEVKPTYLLHFAWVTTPGKYWTSLENIRWVQASLDLLMNFVNQGGKRAVLAGTCAEYDWSYGYCSEKLTPATPTSLYGTCKHSLQEMLQYLCRQVGLSWAWGRIFFLYGPHEHPNRLVPTVVRSLLKGEIAHCSHGEQIRDFLFVKDVASAFVALLESPIEGPVNIASGQPIALKCIIESISQRLGCPRLIKFGAVPTLTDEPPLLVANTTRLTQEVGWKQRYTLEEGLSATIDWWSSNLEALSENQ